MAIAKQSGRRWTASSLILFLLATNIYLVLRNHQLQGHLERFHEELEAEEHMRFPLLLEGTPVPNLALETYRGEKLFLEELLGRELLLVFSSPDCEICREMHHQLQIFQELNPQTEVALIAKGSPEENRVLAERERLSFPVLQWTEEIAAAFLVPQTPFFVIIDPGGKVKGTGFAATAAEIQILVEGAEPRWRPNEVVPRERLRGGG